MSDKLFYEVEELLCKQDSPWAGAWKNEYLARVGGQNIIKIFSKFNVSTF